MATRSKAVVSLSPAARTTVIGGAFPVQQRLYTDDTDKRIVDPQVLSVDTQYIATVATYTLSLNERGLINLNREEALQLGLALISATYNEVQRA